MNTLKVTDFPSNIQKSFRGYELSNRQEAAKTGDNLQKSSQGRKPLESETKPASKETEDATIQTVREILGNVTNESCTPIVIKIEDDQYSTDVINNLFERLPVKKGITILVH